MIVIQTPPSYMKTMSNAIGVFLEMQGIKLLEGDVWGHRKDLDEYFTVPDAYFTVPDEAVEAIKSMTEKGATPDEMAKEIQKTARLGTDLIKYIAKTEITA